MCSFSSRLSWKKLLMRVNHWKGNTVDTCNLIAGRWVNDEQKDEKSFPIKRLFVEIRIQFKAKTLQYTLNRSNKYREKKNSNFRYYRFLQYNIWYKTKKKKNRICTSYYRFELYCFAIIISYGYCVRIVKRWKQFHWFHFFFLFH